jgi:hypothetical protein
VRRAAALVLLVVLAAGCGSGGSPKGSVGVFMTSVLREEINGQWAQQWTQLNPAHQKLITKAEYVSCSRRMGTNIATGKETFHVLAVENDPIHVQGVSQHTAKLVTISFKSPGTQALTYRLHAVADGSRWTWILGDKFLTEIDHGRCLDGTPLSSGSSS